MQDAESAPEVQVSELLSTASEQDPSARSVTVEEEGSNSAAEPTLKPLHVITSSLVSYLVGYVILLLA